MNKLVTIPKVEYLLLKAIQQDMSELVTERGIDIEDLLAHDGK
jgi:hypothetical protein